MLTVERLEDAIHVAQELGYEIREEALEDSPGGLCQVGSKKMIFLNSFDLPGQRLQVLLEALEEAAEPIPRQSGLLKKLFRRAA